VVTRGYVVEDGGEGVALDAPPHLPRGGVLVGRRRAAALVVRQLYEKTPSEERRPVIDVVGVLERVVALLRHEDLVVVPVDGGLARHDTSQTYL
jgi:hypothetical protein